MNNPVKPFRNFRDPEENDTVLLILTHLDEDKVNAAPVSLNYRIDDLTNGREVLGWTSVSTPGATNTITITKAQNAFNNRSKDREMRQVTVNAVDSAGNEGYDIFIYTLARIFDSSDKVN